MTEHLSNQEIEQYRRGLAPPAKLLALDDHLANCAACRARAAMLAEAETRVAAFKADYRGVAAEAEHLDYEELAAYLDGGLDDVGKEVVRSHLVVCLECAQEERDLRDFKTAIAPGLHKAYDPAVATPAKTSPWQWLSERWQAYRAWAPVWQMAAAIALLLVAGTAGWLVWNAQRKAMQQTQVAKDAGTGADAVAKDEGSKANTGDDGAPAPTATINQATEVLVALNDGNGRVMLNRDGRLIGLEELPPLVQTAVKAALQKQQAANAAALAGLGSDDGALMSGQPKSGEFDVLKPRGEVVASDHPSFRWRALDGATHYTVKVFDRDFNLVAESPALTTSAWRPAQPLARGAVYSWQVTAVKDGQEVKAPRPPAPQARFRVLDDKAAAELQTVRRQQPASHLTLGVLYARAGLLAEAERELRALLQANPQSEVVRKLLADVRAAHRTRQ